MTKERKCLQTLGYVSFTIVLLLLIPINTLIFIHTVNYHSYTNPCDAATRWGDKLNPDDNNNICILSI